MAAAVDAAAHGWDAEADVVVIGSGIGGLSAAALCAYYGMDVRVSTAAGSITLPVAVRDDVSPGCVCIPQGWAEANVNALVDVHALDRLAGTSVLSGIGVDVVRA